MWQIQPSVRLCPSISDFMWDFHEVLYWFLYNSFFNKRESHENRSSDSRTESVVVIFIFLDRFR